MRRRELQVNKWTHERMHRMRQIAGECILHSTALYFSNPFFATFWCNELLPNRSRLNCISSCFFALSSVWRKWMKRVSEVERERDKLNSYLQVVCTATDMYAEIYGILYARYEMYTNMYLYTDWERHKKMPPPDLCTLKRFFTLSPRRQSEKDCTNIEIYFY